MPVDDVEALGIRLIRVSELGRGPDAERLQDVLTDTGLLNGGRLPVEPVEELGDERFRRLDGRERLFQPVTPQPTRCGEFGREYAAGRRGNDAGGSRDAKLGHAGLL